MLLLFFTIAPNKDDIFGQYMSMPNRRKGKPKAKDAARRNIAAAISGAIAECAAEIILKRAGWTVERTGIESKVSTRGTESGGFEPATATDYDRCHPDFFIHKGEHQPKLHVEVKFRRTGAYYPEDDDEKQRILNCIKHLEKKCIKTVLILFSVGECARRQKFLFVKYGLFRDALLKGTQGFKLLDEELGDIGPLAPKGIAVNVLSAARRFLV